MNNDKAKVYLLEVILLIVLFFTLFVSNIYKTIYLAIFVFCYSLIVSRIIKKRMVTPYHKKEVVILMGVFAFIYLVVFYLLGIYFGFNRASVKFGLTAIGYFILPLGMLIYATEKMREIFLGYKDKIVRILIFIITVLIDLIIYAEVYDIYKLDDFLMILGFIFFASVANNLLYNYISIRFGRKGIIIYRYVTVMYMYIIPVIPNVYIFFRSFLRIIYPYLIYLFIDNTYFQNRTDITYKSKKKEMIWTGCMMIGLTLIIMLISCQFKYGILVIGSGSMTGSLDKGDATIFVRYDKQNIKKGDVIIFNKDKLQIVHRVVNIKDINGEVRYYTKGDANQEMDDFYLTDKDILGISKLRIRSIGYPSIWLKEIFS